MNSTVRKPYDPRVVAVIVTYNPNLEELSRLIDVLTQQFLQIVIVDNGSRTAIGPLVGDHNSVHLIQNDLNLGVAEGQNIGIAWAKLNAADYVILFDQDSLPELDMIPVMVKFAESKKYTGNKFGAVGPTRAVP